MTSFSFAADLRLRTIWLCVQAGLLYVLTIMGGATGF